MFEIGWGGMESGCTFQETSFTWDLGKLIPQLNNSTLNNLPDDLIQILTWYRPSQVGVVGQLKETYHTSTDWYAPGGFPQVNPDPSPDLYGKNIPFPYVTAFDPQGNLVVVEHTFGQLRTFSPEGKSLSVFTLPKGGYPTGLAFQKNGNFIVTEGSTASVAMYRSNNIRIKWLEGPSQPSSVAVDQNDNIYVADSSPRAQKILVFNPEGNFTHTITDEQFQRPSGVVISPQTGEIVVVDENRHKVFIFDPFGTKIRSIRLDGRDKCPRCVTLDAGGNLIAPSNSPKLTVYSYHTGELLRKIDCGFDGRHVTIDHEGTMYITCGETNKLMVWK